MPRPPNLDSTTQLRLADVLGALARSAPDAAALVFLENGLEESGRLSRRQLHARAMQAAAALRDRDLVEARVLLAFHSSLDYVVAFLGCLYAGVIAIPVYPPRQNWHARRLAAIARDAGASVVLTSSSLCVEVHARLQTEADSLTTIGLDALFETTARIHHTGSPGNEGWINDNIDHRALAYLQYTSGSTGDPKGVMISHSNLLANTAFIAESAGIGEGGAFVSWLPIYHDMGLVAGILLPLVLGATAVFMPPAAFVQQPLNWLRALDKYRGRFSAAPNFAYELCAARSTSEQAASLDLSNWEVALNGAEPISARTLDAFNARFTSAREGLISGGYGMAESTLVVTIGALNEVVPRLSVDKSALERNRIGVTVDGSVSALLCSSGRVRPGFDVCSVHPESCIACGPLEVGEIWVAGPSVAGGYWQRHDESEAVFGARIVDTTGELLDRRWLRTGDLGFVHEGHLYVTGRLKDLVIVRGANHYPQDLERTAEEAYPGLRQTGYGAAFTQSDALGGSRLVIVQEVERAARRQIDVAAATRAIAEAIAREHGIDVDLVVLVPPATVPKTSSGKIQRRACRVALGEADWTELGRWERSVVSNTVVLDGPKLESELKSVVFSHTDPLPWLRDCVARLVARSADEVEPLRPLLDQGLDSMKLVELTALIGRASGQSLPATIAFDHPTLDALAAYLRSDVAPSGVDSSPSRPAARAEPIAIVGLDCRVPGATGPERFWELLCSERDPICEASQRRAALTGWRAAGDAPHRFVGWIDDIDRFDAAAFGISPREARSMDPQQRLLLESSWHALERAHIAPDSLAGTPTGVFIGICSNDYYRLHREQGAALDAYSGTGGASSIAANRISYCFGLNGPSLSIDTACSSSLVAIHQACASLAAGECELALAGGVNLVLGEDLGTVFESAGMLASDGRCKTFDASADGYVRGEGCGVLVLKRLSDAQRDGDPVLAVLAGSAVNQDGASNGLTAPSGIAQQRVVGLALERAGVAASSIDIIETHGTGTALGDPVEVHALRAVLGGESSLGGEPCWLGAVKSRIGHLEAAAGVTGVIKVVLAMKHGLIPANGHFVEMNPKIDLGTSRLRIAREAVAWPARAERPRRAGVSSFGFGGTNAHLILEEAPAPLAGSVPGPQASWKLHTLSAANPEALRLLAEAHADALDKAVDSATAEALSQVANTGRARLPERLSVCAVDTARLIGGLRSWARGSAPADMSTSSVGSAARPRRLAFLFTGQGSQYAGMGAELIATEPAFKQALERCAEVLRPLLDVPLFELLFGSETARLADTRYAQPALAALQISLVELWAHYGVVPAAVCGHSVGEYAAAVCSGLMTAETALTLVVARARLMGQAEGRGAMLSVARSEAEVFSVLGRLVAEVDIAANNSPRQTVLSGDEAAITEALVRINAAGFSSTRLSVSHAFHSRLMEPVLAEFAPHVRAGEFGKARVPWALTGGASTADPASADYWVQQIRNPVRFAQALRSLEQQGIDAFLEIGPGSALLSLARDTVGVDVRIASLAGPARDASRQFIASLGAWWVAGGTPELGRLRGERVRRPVDLPVRAFKDTHHWFHTEPSAAASVSSSAAPEASLVLRSIDLARDDLHVFDTVPGHEVLAALRDHVVAGSAVMPAAGWISLAVAAARHVRPAAVSCALDNVYFERPIALSRQPSFQTSLSLPDDASDGTVWRVSVSGRIEPSGAWARCAQADVRMNVARISGDWSPTAAASDWISMPVRDFYADWSRLGLAYGPAFQLISRLSRRVGEVRAELRAPLQGITTAGKLDPAWLDAAFQSVGSMLLDDASVSHRVPVPVQVDSFWVAATAANTTCVVHARVREKGVDTVVVDLQIASADGEVIVEATGLALRWIEGLVGVNGELASAKLSNDIPVRLYETDWVPLAPTTKSTAVHDWWVAFESGEHARQFIEASSREGLQVRQFGALLGQPEQFEAAFAEMTTGLVPGHAQGLLVVLSASADTGIEFDAHVARGGVALCRELQSLLVSCQVFAERGPFRVSLLTAPAAAAPHHCAAAAMWRSAARELHASRVLLTLGERPLDTSPADTRCVVAALAGEAPQWRVGAGRLEAPRFVAAARGATAVPMVVFDPGRSVLITGGTGALGLQLAQRLVDRGARALWLVSRHAGLSSIELKRVQAWRDSGCTVEVAQVELSVRVEVERLLTSIAESGHPLCGVVHAAGANAEALLADLDDARWQAAVNGKVFGGLWLDELTRDLQLDFFVAFSSAVVPLGSAGQCNYAAANGLLEQIVARRARGSHSGERTVSLQWGPWLGAGLADSLGVRTALAHRGIGALAIDEALDAFEQALGGAEVTLLVGRFEETLLATGSFDAPCKEAASARPSLQELLTMDRSACVDAIRRVLAGSLVRVLDLDVSESLARSPETCDELRLSSLGLDSLMAMEVRNELRRWIGVDLPAHLLIGNTEIAEVIALVHQKVMLLSLSRVADTDQADASDMEMEVL